MTRKPLEDALEAATDRTNIARAALKRAQAELQRAIKAEGEADRALIRYDAEAAIRAGVGR